MISEGPKVLLHCTETLGDSVMVSGCMVWNYVIVIVSARLGMKKGVEGKGNYITLKWFTIPFFWG